MISLHRIEETWRLWQKFLDDFSHFEEWLAMSERTAALPNSSGVLYTVAKEELKKFEVQVMRLVVSQCFFFSFLTIINFLILNMHGVFKVSQLPYPNYFLLNRLSSGRCMRA